MSLHLTHIGLCQVCMLARGAQPYITLFCIDFNLLRMATSAQVLDTQYRMHPAITAFTSREFYPGLLHDAPDMAELMTAPWHGHAGLGPLAFYDVRGASRSALSRRCSAPQSSELIRPRRRAHPVLSLTMRSAPEISVTCFLSILMMLRLLGQIEPIHWCTVQ